MPFVFDAKRIKWFSCVDWMAARSAVQFQKLGNNSQQLQRFGRLSPHLIVLVPALEIGFPSDLVDLRSCAAYVRFSFLRWTENAQIDPTVICSRSLIS